MEIGSIGEVEEGVRVGGELIKNVKFFEDKIMGAQS